MSEFRQRCKETAKRFLRTVVIVDDEAYNEPAQSPGALEKPTRHTVGSRPSTTAAESSTSVTDKTEERAAEKVGSHRLDTRTLVESFSRQGLICAVLAPRPGADPSDIVDLSVKRTDIVILDWQLNGDDGQRTLSILRSILKEDAGERLRLIAIYTGEQEISEIGRTIVRECSGSKRKFAGDARDIVLSYRHCRIVIYSKSNLPKHLSDRSLSESNLPEALIGDFAAMGEGLLPNIALMSLAAIRENVHKVLDRFDAELDPALLTHRACLSVPDDSQQHMVSQLASELHAIMEDAVATVKPEEMPAGMDAIKEWLDTSLGVGEDTRFGEGKMASRDDIIALLHEGWEERKPDCLKKKDFKYLTTGFSKGERTDHLLDHRLAWMFHFRTIFNAPLPILQLGTVLCKTNDSNASYYLCMRPKCDSVRLRGKTIFLLLPLIESDKNLIQIVLRTDRDTYRRFGVCTEMDQWLLAPFEPSQDGESIVAKRGDPSDDPLFYFSDAGGSRYDWIGELKAEFAQRMAHEFASRLSRVAVTDSELLRRGAKL